MREPWWMLLSILPTPARLCSTCYDFEATAISFNDLGNGQVQVNATVGNRGITGKDVWIRIYPIIGGGAYEFPIAELRVGDFNPLQTIDLSGNYTLPVTNKSIEFIAIVDDGHDYTEITEHNNNIKISYVLTSIDDDAESQENYLSIYPMPFADEVKFEYLLDKDYRNVTVKVFDLSGKLWVELSNCPSDNGPNYVTWRNTSMPAGNYIYKLTGEGVSGSETLLFTGRMTKVIR